MSISLSTFFRIFVITAVVALLLPSMRVVADEVKKAATATVPKKDDITVLELNQQIKDKKASISSLKNQIKVYENNILLKQKEAASLENETAIVEDRLSKTSLNIEAAEEEIQQLDLEIQQSDLEIASKEQEIGEYKKRLGEYVRKVYQNDQRDYLELLIMNESFNEFFDQVRYLELAQGEVGKSMARIKLLREELMVQRAGLENNKKRQEELAANMVAERDSLDEQRQIKQQLIAQSILSAEKFQDLLSQARAEQAGIDADVVNLEKTVREKLKVFNSQNVAMMWPVPPSRGISSYFHDTTYPFRNVFEHSAIDIRAYQGTPIRAAESGYVARTKFSGKSYAYIMILHDKGLATVYGHPSSISVQPDTYVKKGEVIGYSGGAPGSNGAGSFTTGPHLHFEVRLNGIPVDPLKYLP